MTILVYGTTTVLSGFDAMAPSFVKGWRLAPVSNADGWLDFEIGANIVGGAAVDLKKSVHLYVYSSADSGANWESGGSAAGSYTLDGTELFLGQIPLSPGVKSTRCFRLSQAFRSGRLLVPRDWGLVVVNPSEVPLGTGNSITVRGMREATV